MRVHSCTAAAAAYLAVALLVAQLGPVSGEGWRRGAESSFPAPAVAALEGLLETATAADVPATYFAALAANLTTLDALGESLGVDLDADNDGDLDLQDGSSLGPGDISGDWVAALLGNLTGSAEEAAAVARAAVQEEEALSSPTTTRRLLKHKKKRSPSPKPASNVYQFVQPSPVLRNRIVSITTVFENGNTKLHYGYCSNLNDGRGYTFGRSGFCTGTGDGIYVVGLMAKYRPEAKIWLQYYYAIKDILKSGHRSSVSSIPGFCDTINAWQNDAAMKYAQDLVHEYLYYLPAMKLAAYIGVRYGITKGQLYDAYIQHGWNDNIGDMESIGGIVASAIRASNGRPFYVNEAVWLANFLNIRQQVLSSSGKTWGESINRVKAYRDILYNGNMPLNGPVKLSDGWGVTVP